MEQGFGACLERPAFGGLFSLGDSLPSLSPLSPSLCFLSKTTQMKVYTDGARDDGIVAMGWEIVLDSGEVIQGNRFLKGDYTSMETEYFALLDGIRHARYYGDNVEVYSDCEPLVKKMHYTQDFDGEWNDRRKGCQRLLRKFDDWELSWAPRSSNTRADRLAYEALETGRRS